jgi:hypothetical protein
VVPSTMSPHAHLARSPVGLADKVWLEAVGREPGENSPWYRSHVLAQRPKLASERLIPQERLNLALSEATAAAAVQTLRVRRERGHPLSITKETWVASSGPAFHASPNHSQHDGVTCSRGSHSLMSAKKGCMLKN